MTRGLGNEGCGVWILSALFTLALLPFAIAAAVGGWTWDRITGKAK